MTPEQLISVKSLTTTNHPKSQKSNALDALQGKPGTMSGSDDDAESDSGSVVLQITDEEHAEKLQLQREQCLQDGYMLQPDDFERLHYEDPRVTELKQTDVSLRSRNSIT